MKTVNLNCIECPMGCAIEVKIEGDKVISVTGNGCPRGKAFAENEVICPMRVITTTVRAKNGKMVSVKTDKPVKKTEMFNVVNALKEVRVDTPCKIGDIVIENISDGANVIVTSSVE